MLTDELIYIGNQLAEMTDRELSEVLNQFKRRRNYCLAGEVSSYLNKIMRANDFDYYGEIVEVVPEEITARRNELYENIYTELEALTKILPVTLEVKTENSEPYFTLTVIDSPEYYFKVTPMSWQKLSEEFVGFIEYKSEHSSYSVSYNTQEKFSLRLESWIQDIDFPSLKSSQTTAERRLQ